MQQEGFMWILLDGGPLRAFSDSDIILIEEDFNMLKVIQDCYHPRSITCSCLMLI